MRCLWMWNSSTQEGKPCALQVAILFPCFKGIMKGKQPERALRESMTPILEGFPAAEHHCWYLLCTNPPYSQSCISG